MNKYQKKIKTIDKKLESIGFKLFSEWYSNGVSYRNYMTEDNKDAIHMEVGEPDAALGMEIDACPECGETILFGCEGKQIKPCLKCSYNENSKEEKC